MNKKGFILPLLLSGGLICLAQLAQAEQLTLTTYYPAPYGAYRDMDVAERLYLRPSGAALPGDPDYIDPNDPILEARPGPGMIITDKNAAKTIKYWDPDAGASGDWRPFAVSQPFAAVDVYTIIDGVENNTPVYIFVAAATPKALYVIRYGGPVTNFNNLPQLGDLRDNQDHWDSSWNGFLGTPDTNSDIVGVAIDVTIDPNSGPGTSTVRSALVCVTMSSGRVYARARTNSAQNLASGAEWSGWIPLD